MSFNSLRYMQIKDQLMRNISSLKPHDRLPSRTVLSETYQAARTTIERAISELIGEGLLYARDGSGTYVSEPMKGRNIQDGREIKNWGLLIPDILHLIPSGYPMNLWIPFITMTAVKTLSSLRKTAPIGNLS